MPEQTTKDLKKEIFLMIHKAEEMLELAEDAFTKNKVSPLDEALNLSKEIVAKEKTVTEAISKLASSDSEARAIVSVPARVKKVATTIERIMDNMRTKIRDGLLFSDKAIQETSILLAKAKTLLKKAGEAAVTGAASNAKAILSEGDAIIRMSTDFATAHEERLVAGECSPKSSSTYLCILYAFEEVASHVKDAVKKLTGA